ncbi:MAG: ISNCY family transposase [Anaerolineales bacterium]|nr:ISNCY family transposase [Anaerolineales bacterium]
MDKLLTMSDKEVSRLEVMQRLKEKSLSQREAAKILGVSVRHVRRLFKAYLEKGAAGLVSQRRGRESNNRLSEATRVQALDLLGSKYRGFGPTLACEKLVEVEGLKISNESVRKMMMAEGLWKARRVRKIVTHQMRERRPCRGELVQIDGSPHDWFEGRAPACVLLVFIDDASGNLLRLQFVGSESFFSYCASAQAYFERCGKPVAFYSDKNSIFRVNIPNSGDGDNLTQFGRAMRELQIEIICANTPQAKGRVERANQTLQDRLVKEMRLRGISSLEAGNAYLPEFINDFNRRFGVEPISQHDAHRPLAAQDDFARILAWQEPRTLSKNLTVQFEKVVYQVQTERPTYAMRNARVTVCKDACGNITLLYKEKLLPYTIFHKQAKQSDIVETKGVDSALQNQRKAHVPAPNHPWRKSFATPLAK